MSQKDPREVHRRLFDDAMVHVAHQRERDAGEPRGSARIRPLTRLTDRRLLARMSHLSEFELAQLRALPLRQQVALAHIVAERGEEWARQHPMWVQVGYSQAALFDYWDEFVEQEAYRREGEDA